MTTTEAALLSHYNLNTLNPIEWPVELDEEDASLEDGAQDGALQRGPSVRYSVPGAQKNRSNIESLVQKDEADPLSGAPSIVQVLQQRGLPVEDNFRLRNRFLLSSTTFSPSLYLSEVHKSASTQELLEGLDFLSRSIEEKSASLKVLVESNFERFVRAKATIDNVYSEMRQEKDGASAETAKPDRSSKMFSRGISSRNVSGAAKVPPTSRGGKNALVKESEYGLAGIKTPLTDATTKAEEIWAPAFGGRQREEQLRSVLDAVEKNHDVLEAGALVDESIKKRDYTKLASQYQRANKHAVETKIVAERAQNNGLQLSDEQIQQILITARVWTDMERRTDDFKQDVWKRLRNPDLYQGKDEHIDLISILLELGVSENPIPVWLDSRQKYLQVKITTTFEQARIELEIQRRRLASSQKPAAAQIAAYLHTAGDARQNQNQNQDDYDLDTVPVIRFWDKICSSLEALLSLRNGVLAEVLDFATSVSSVVDGKLQRSLPTGIEGNSRKHHKLESDQVRKAEEDVLELFTTIRKQIHALFIESPLEDMSALFDTAFDASTTTVTSPKRSRMGISSEDVPDTVPQSGESWEKFAFWPPRGTSLSGSAFLSRIVNIIGTGASEIGANEFALKDEGTLAHLRNLISDVRERSITAICAAWVADAESCRGLEHWTRSSEKKDLTTLPAYLSAYESKMLENLQAIIHLRIAQSMVIPPSPQRHLETVQRAFKTSLYKAFTSIMENAANPSNTDSGSDDDTLASPARQTLALESINETFNVTNVVCQIRGFRHAFMKLITCQNVRKLLTISNFQYLRSEVVPALLTQFETKFALSTPLTDDAKAFRDVLGQMHARVFQAYVRPVTESLRVTITNGIISHSYATPVRGNSSSESTNPSRPIDAKPYVYDVLLSLVHMHTEISSTTPSQTHSILAYMLEQISSALLHSFKQRSRYTLSALMQATLDVEFTAQTLNNYTTEKASEIQGQIYLALDERTDNEARMSLQQELPEMRAILKRLREGTRGEFACFKRERRRERGGERKESGKKEEMTTK